MINKILNIRHKLSKKFIIVFAIILALVGLGYYLIFSRNPSQNGVTFAEVKRQDLKSTITASGSLAGKDSSKMRFGSSGKLQSLNVKVGDEIKKGSLIGQLDLGQLSIALQQSRNTLVAKQATAYKIEDDVKGHDADETFTQRELRVAAETARDNAYDSVRAAEKALKDAYLYSPLGGIVVSVNVVQGQNISVADIVVEVVDASEIYFDAEVDESDVAKVAVGQAAEVSLNSYPDKTFPATVAQIFPQTETNTTGATVVIVRVKMAKEAVRFINNLNGQVDIVAEEADNVLTIPSDAVWDSGFVLVKSDQKYKKVPVTFGISSGTDIEVKTGLTEGIEVVANPETVDLKLIQG